MPAYIVFTRERTLDADELDAYSQAVEGTLAGHPVKVLAAYGDQQVLEGSPIEGVVILEFPSMDDARTWYDSADYQKVRRHRLKGAQYRAVIVDGP